MNQKISVVIPVYNVERYLDRCLQSVVNQTYTNLQILLVDDGSTDGSGRLAEQWASRDARIVVLHKPNGGLSDARNYAMRYAEGEYWAFVDSDDFIRPQMMEGLLKACLQHEAQIAVCDMEYLYDDGRRDLASGGDVTVGQLRQHPELIRINNSACNKLFAASLFDEVRFPKAMWYEDLATVPMLCMRAQRMVKVNEPYYVYYQRSGSIAHSASLKIFHIYEAIQRVIDDIRAHCDNEEMKQQLIAEMQHCYIIHGLDLTTLRIKDFDRSEDRAGYLAQNMQWLRQVYPQWQNDAVYRSWGWKKKLIAQLMNHGQWKAVLGIYDRSGSN